MTTINLDTVCEFLRTYKMRVDKFEVFRRQLNAIANTMLCASRLIDKGELFDLRQTEKLQAMVDELIKLRGVFE